MKKSILEVVNESAKGLYDAELMDAKTMYIFDLLCLPLARELNQKIQNKCISLHMRLSLPVFEKHLNSGASAIKK